jgi:hypothetical protein
MAALPNLVRTISLALLGSTSERMRNLTEWDTAIRAPITTSRRISFVQLHGGVGASTTAHYVTGLLAVRRRGLVLGVDAAGRGGGLGELVGRGDDAARRDSRSPPKTAAEATSGLHRGVSGMHLLTVEAAQSGAVPTTAAWVSSVAPVARFFDTVCTDWGERGVRADLADVAALSHTICLVARSDRQHAEEAVSVVAAIEASVESPDVVVALVDVGDSAGLGPVTVMRSSAATVVSVPYDRGWASAVAGQPVELAMSTRLAYTQLSALLIEPGMRIAATLDSPEAVVS